MSAKRASDTRPRREVVAQMAVYFTERAKDHVWAAFQSIVSEIKIVVETKN